MTNSKYHKTKRRKTHSGGYWRPRFQKRVR